MPDCDGIDRDGHGRPKRKCALCGSMVRGACPCFTPDSSRPGLLPMHFDDSQPLETG